MANSYFNSLPEERQKEFTIVENWDDFWKKRKEESTNLEEIFSLSKIVFKNKTIIKGEGSIRLFFSDCFFLDEVEVTGNFDDIF